MAYTPPNPNGSATSANSSPVVIASDQATVKTKLATDIADVTGTITTNSSTVVMTSLEGVCSVTVSIAGTYNGVNMTFEAYDGVNWFTIPAIQVNSAAPAPTLTSGVLTNASTMWNVSPLLGVDQFRVRATAWVSGTANIRILPSAQFTQYLGQVVVSSLPAVTANLGTGGTSATSLGKARDAVAGGTDTNTVAMMIRRDSPTSVTPAVGDYEIPQIDSTGSQWVREKPSPTATLSNVASSATNTTILASNAQRRGATIWNDSTSVLYIKFGTTASTTSVTAKLIADAYYEVPSEYTGIIDGIWSAASGFARVTEIT